MKCQRCGKTGFKKSELENQNTEKDPLMCCPECSDEIDIENKHKDWEEDEDILDDNHDWDFDEAGEIE